MPHSLPSTHNFYGRVLAARRCPDLAVWQSHELCIDRCSGQGESNLCCSLLGTEFVRALYPTELYSNAAPATRAVCFGVLRSSRIRTCDLPLLYLGNLPTRLALLSGVRHRLSRGLVFGGQ